jgi:hypothetical protein
MVYAGKDITYVGLEQAVPRACFRIFRLEIATFRRKNGMRPGTEPFGLSENRRAGNRSASLRRIESDPAGLNHRKHGVEGVIGGNVGRLVGAGVVKRPVGLVVWV